MTLAEHARHHELAAALGKKLAALVRELLDERADQVLPVASAPLPARRGKAPRQRRPRG